MTPSEAHDSARNRDAGHDEMQAAVWRFYNDNPWPNGVRLKSRYRTDAVLYRPQNAYVEFPFKVKNGIRGSTSTKIIGFADVLLHLCTVERDEAENDKEWRSKRGAEFSPDWVRIAFEIKPIIYSVGSVIRQCQALHHIANLSDIPCSVVRPVVKASDPKLDLLRELMPETIAWDGDYPA